MALTDKSLLLYGFTVTTANQNLPFLNVSLGAQINASVPAGYYSLSGLATAIALAMNTADPTNTYTCTVNRAAGSNHRDQWIVPIDPVVLWHDSRHLTEGSDHLRSY